MCFPPHWNQSLASDLRAGRPRPAEGQGLLPSLTWGVSLAPPDQATFGMLRGSGRAPRGPICDPLTIQNVSVTKPVQRARSRGPPARRLHASPHPPLLPARSRAEQGHRPQALTEDGSPRAAFFWTLCLASAAPPPELWPQDLGGGSEALRLGPPEPLPLGRCGPRARRRALTPSPASFPLSHSASPEVNQETSLSLAGAVRGSAGIL